MVTNSKKSKRSLRWHRIYTRLGVNLPEPARMGFHAILLCLVPICCVVWLLVSLVALQFNFHVRFSLVLPLSLAYMMAFSVWWSLRSERRKLKEAGDNVD